MTKNAAVIGLGDMGSGIAKNLIKAGFHTAGFDIDQQRLRKFEEFGGKPAINPAEAGHHADSVFVMVMNGQQARSVIFDDDGLIQSMKENTGILMTATIDASEVRNIHKNLQGSGIDLIDTPVSGGFPGAQDGTLTMMAAASDSILDRHRLAMEAVSSSIHRVGTEVGSGLSVKACLQSLIGSIFSATFEASVMAAAAGVDAESLYRVFASSSAGSLAVNSALENIIDGKFENSGSHIRTMYKDMTLAMDLARQLSVPLFTAAAAMQLFQAGISRYPNGDNWAVTKITEEIVGKGLRRASARP